VGAGRRDDLKGLTLPPLVSPMERAKVAAEKSMNRRLRHELQIRRQIDELYRKERDRSVKSFEMTHESVLVGSPLSSLNISPKSFRTVSSKSPLTRHLEPLQHVEQQRHRETKRLHHQTQQQQQQQHHETLHQRLEPVHHQIQPIEQQQQQHEILDNKTLRLRISHNDPRLGESPYAQQGAAVLIETRSTYSASSTPTFVSGRIVEASKKWNDTLRPEPWRGEFYFDIEDLMLHAKGETKNLCGLSYVKIRRSLKYTASSSTPSHASASYFTALAVLTGSTGHLLVMFSPVSISSLAFKCDPFSMMTTDSSSSANQEVFHPYRDSKTGEEIPLSTRAGGWLVLGATSMNRFSERRYDEEGNSIIPSGCSFLSSDSGISYLSKWNGKSRNSKPAIVFQDDDNESSIDTLAAHIYIKELRRYRSADKITFWWRRRKLNMRIHVRLNRKIFFRALMQRTDTLMRELKTARYASKCANIALCAANHVSKLNLCPVLAQARCVRAATSAFEFSRDLCLQLDRTILGVAIVLASTAAKLSSEEASRVVVAMEAVMSVMRERKNDDEEEEVFVVEEEEVVEEEKLNKKKKKNFRVSIANGIKGRKRIQARELTVSEEDTVLDLKNQAIQEFRLGGEEEELEVELCRWDRKTQKVTSVEDFQSHVLISLNDSDQINHNS
jgi:hypothetical protein